MKSIILAGLIIIFLFSAGCASDRSFDARLNSIVNPYRFSIAGWESEALTQEIGRWLSGGDGETDNAIRPVIDYFDCVKRIKALKSEIGMAATGNGNKDTKPLEEELNKLEERKTALIETVEEIMEGQVRDTLAEQGIFNPFTDSESTFPPVNFRLEQLPSLLVISPRDRIESIREFTLKPGLVIDEKEAIEEKVDKLGVSSLVTEIGGIATYPSLVDSQSSLRHVIDTIIEEWLHLYLAFKPLGFR